MVTALPARELPIYWKMNNIKPNFKEVSHDLFKAVSAALDGRAFPVIECDSMHLYSLAAKNGVSQMLALSDDFCSQLDDESLKKVVNKKLHRIHQMISQDYEYSILKERLTSEKIKFLPIKGILLRELYPVREMRTSNDIDIYYDKSRREDVRAIMNELGYEMYHSDANHDEYLKGEVNIEMHHNLCMQIEVIDKYYSDVWQKSVQVGGYEYHFSPSDEYIYTVFHAMKHFKFGGIDMRPMLDMYILENKCQLDFEYINAELAKIDLLKFGQQMRSLCKAWLSGKELSESEYILTEYILLGGYGDTTVLVKDEGGSKLSYAIRRVFPSYRFMSEKYPALQKRPAALPYYYAKRLIGFVTKDKDRLSKEKDILAKDNTEKSKKLRQIFDITGL